jgi:hypothetical protein
MSTNTNTFPAIPKELLDELNKRFPEKTPKVGTPIDTIWVDVGQREVIRFLNQKFKEQIEAQFGRTNDLALNHTMKV